MALCSTSLEDNSISVLVENVMLIDSEESGLFQTDSLLPGYAVSPDGAAIAFLRDVHETGKTRKLRP